MTSSKPSILLIRVKPEAFPWKSGTIQGYLFFSLPFNILLKVAAVQLIRQNKAMRGIRLGREKKKEVKLT